MKQRKTASRALLLKGDRLVKNLRIGIFSYRNLWTLFSRCANYILFWLPTIKRVNSECDRAPLATDNCLFH